jgi:hypothetical protein
VAGGSVAPASRANPSGGQGRAIGIVSQVLRREGGQDLASSSRNLARHQYDLAPAVRIELERRHVCV